MMNLYECFSLAFPGHANDGALDPSGLLHAVESFLPNVSTTLLQDTKPQQMKQGSIADVVRCIVSEWGTNAQTNFYIPPQHFSGYSYLFEDDGQSGRLSFNGEIQRGAHHYARTNFYGHHHPAFVYAEEPNNLHPHHYEVYNMRGNSPHMPKMTVTSIYSSFNSTRLQVVSVNGRSVYHRESSAHAPRKFEPAQMTIPYIHPQLNMPVPPLHLPWYFGALCWSFALAGVVMLNLPQNWTLRGGGRVAGSRMDEYRRHWFPYRAFAWVLILCQSPCSFLADYVHMTNISSWHPIDRFLACILMSMELVKIVVMRPYTRPLIYILYLICCGVAICCFLKSQEAQKRLDADGFVFWHNGWHCYPITGTIVHFLESYLNRRWAEYYSFDGAGDEREDSTGCVQCGILFSQFKHPKDDTVTKKSIRTVRVICHDGRHTSSVTDANGMLSLGIRRSRRIEGMKVKLQTTTTM